MIRARCALLIAGLLSLVGCEDYHTYYFPIDLSKKESGSAAVRILKPGNYSIALGFLRNHRRGDIYAEKFFNDSIVLGAGGGRPTKIWVRLSCGERLVFEKTAYSAGADGSISVYQGEEIFSATLRDIGEVAIDKGVCNVEFSNLLIDDDLGKIDSGLILYFYEPKV